MKNSKSIYSAGEVAKLCGVTHRTVVNWIQRDQLLAYKLPGTRGDNRITHEVLCSFLEKHSMPLPSALKPKPTAEIDVLIVDDDLAMLNAIRRVCRRAGYTASLAHDGFEAGRLFEKFRPKLVTLDLQMPYMDGRQVLKQIRKQDQNTKIIVISAASEETLKHARQLGADEVMKKPFDNEQLITQMDTLLA